MASGALGRTLAIAAASATTGTVTASTRRRWRDAADGGWQRPVTVAARWFDWPRQAPVDAAGIACAIGYGTIAWLARQPGEPPLAAFIAIAGGGAAITFGLYGWLRRAGATLTVGRLIFWALAFRLCGLIGGPFYEDDFHRFLWDGYRFATAGTPYGTPPEAHFTDPAVPAIWQRLLDRINNPDLTTIYGPVTQSAFLLAYAVRPGSVAALQGVFIVADLLLIALLLRLAPARAVLLYAWCPLVVKEVAFTAHPDGLAVALLLAAIVAVGAKRLAAAAVCVGLAAAAKTVALLLAPVVLLRCRLRHWTLCAATVGVAYLPFVLQGASDLTTLSLFARQWRYNAGLFDVLATTISDAAARLLAGGALLIFLIWLVRREWRLTRNAERAPPPRGDWLFGAWLALSPVVNPWYLLWVLPFAAIYPSAWAWTASLAMCLAYVNGLNLETLRLHPYDHPGWLRPLEYGAILLAVGVDLARRRARGSAPNGGVEP